MEGTVRRGGGLDSRLEGKQVFILGGAPQGMANCAGIVHVPLASGHHKDEDACLADSLEAA